MYRATNRVAPNRMTVIHKLYELVMKTRSASSKVPLNEAWKGVCVVVVALMLLLIVGTRVEVVVNDDVSVSSVANNGDGVGNGDIDVVVVGISESRVVGVIVVNELSIIEVIFSLADLLATKSFISRIIRP